MLETLPGPNLLDVNRTAIQVRGLGVTIPGGRQQPLEVLRSIDLDVPEREFLSVIGSSGCGKTTLLHALAGLRRWDVGGLDVHGRVAMVFQRPTLLPWRNVLDNATFGAEAAGQDRAQAREIAASLLCRVGLGQHLVDHPHQLSEGMKQRVNLVRALLVEPDVLLMDEPFSALDELTKRDLQNLVVDLWEERNLTVIFVSHSLPEVAYLSDRVAVLSPKPSTIAGVFSVDIPRPRYGRAAAARVHESAEVLRGLLQDAGNQAASGDAT